MPKIIKITKMGPHIITSFFSSNAQQGGTHLAESLCKKCLFFFQISGNFPSFHRETAGNFGMGPWLFNPPRNPSKKGYIPNKYYHVIFPVHPGEGCEGSGLPKPEKSLISCQVILSSTFLGWVFLHPQWNPCIFQPFLRGYNYITKHFVGT